MTIGGGIFLAVIGAILFFAVDAEIAGIDIQVIGVILMIAGIAGIILGFVMTRPFGTRTVESAPRDRVVERERPRDRVVERERPTERVVERERDV